MISPLTIDMSRRVEHIKSRKNGSKYRLNEELQRKRATPLAGRGAEAFEPFTAAAPVDVDAYFSKELGLNVREASAVGWSLYCS